MSRTVLKLTLLVCLSWQLAPARTAELSVADTAPNRLVYKQKLLEVLVKQVPQLLNSCDPQTGRFGTGIWICTDQNLMYPLAAAYAFQDPANPYYKEKKLLDVVVKAGDALIADADQQGRWVFRKKDGSTWGKIWMPWTYSRWLRSFALVRDDMPPDRRGAWEKALTLGYTGIAASQLRSVHNIPAHHAMGLYLAGRVMNRPEWCEQAAKFFSKVIVAQAEGGYWSENYGPVVGYNFVYLDALGTYHALSGDRRVLDPLQTGAAFHYRFRYPDGSRIETIDERNPYHNGLDLGNVGFTFSEVGRAYLMQQWSRHGWDNLPADLIASLLLYGSEGPLPPSSPDRSRETFVLNEAGRDLAATIRHGPWFVCLSAYATAIPKNRWIQDRQNFVSIYHDRVALILGGGNTKLQPAWSNFTVGDMTLLRHEKADRNPDFMPKGELYHVPSAVSLIRSPDFGLDLTYGPQDCSIRIVPVDDNTLNYVLESKAPSRLAVAAHLTLIPKLGRKLESAAGRTVVLDGTPLDWNPEQVAGALTHAGCRLRLPPCASVHWPALPHNPYRRDGSATPAEGRIEIRIPLDAQHQTYTVTIEILKASP